MKTKIPASTYTHPAYMVSIWKTYPDQFGRTSVFGRPFAKLSDTVLYALGNPPIDDNTKVVVRIRERIDQGYGLIVIAEYVKTPTVGENVSGMAYMPFTLVMTEKAQNLLVQELKEARNGNK